MKVRPIGNKVLIRVLPQKNITEGGLHLPDKYGGVLPVREGVVIAIGHTAYGCEGCLKEQKQIKVGDKVMFFRMSGEELDHEGEKCRLVIDTEIIGVVEE